jgi:hypothetical protein
MKPAFLRRAIPLFGLLCLVAAGTAWAAPQIADNAKNAGLVPHKALYDINLVGTKSGSQIVNIKGQMFYEWQSACDGWISNHRFNLYYEYADSPAMQITSDFSTYETFDGKTMNFTSQRKRDGRLFEELRGAASLGEDSKGEVTYSIPKDLVFDLPKGSLFPMGHTLNVIDMITKGKKFYKATIFDGSDEEGPVEVNAFIGKSVNAPSRVKPSPEIDMNLINNPARQVRLAFFPLNDPSATSDYEMNVIFHQNGIISDMLIEYDDFTVSQKLVALEKLDTPCEEVQVRGGP